MLRWDCYAEGAPKRRNKRGRGWILPGIVLMLGAGLTVFSLLDADRAAHPGAELGAIRTCAHRHAAIRARLMTALTLFTCTLDGGSRVTVRCVLTESA